MVNAGGGVCLVTDNVTLRQSDRLRGMGHGDHGAWRGHLGAGDPRRLLARSVDRQADATRSSKPATTRTRASPTSRPAFPVPQPNSVTPTESSLPEHDDHEEAQGEDEGPHAEVRVLGRA